MPVSDHGGLHGGLRTYRSCAGLRVISRHAHRARVCAQSWIVADDAGSRRALKAAVRTSSRGTEPVPVHIRSLAGSPIWIRPGTTDSEVCLATFAGRYHRPPRLSFTPHLIWDLGSHIGLTMRDYAHLYPQARIVGVELDSANASLARHNLLPLLDRCELINGAVSSVPGPLQYDLSPGADGFRLARYGEGRADGITLNELLRRTGTPDFVKMDIEGAESAVLSHDTNWARRVRAISVECHAPYSLAECAEALTRLGFSVIKRPRNLMRRGNDCAIGLRA